MENILLDKRNISNVPDQRLRRAAQPVRKGGGAKSAGGSTGCDAWSSSLQRMVRRFRSLWNSLPTRLRLKEFIGVIARTRKRLVCALNGSVVAGHVHRDGWVAVIWRLADKRPLGTTGD